MGRDMLGARVAVIRKFGVATAVTSRMPPAPSGATISYGPRRVPICNDIPQLTVREL